MANESFKKFLFESKSNSIDFKQNQYNFSIASDEEKPELLKDILVMTNSRRKTEGFIIPGTIDEPDKPNKIYGITMHNDDSGFQQFINLKTNRVCEFEYMVVTHEGLKALCYKYK